MAYGTVNADIIGTSVPNVTLGAGNATVFKNRIINGDMRIDQRNAGASSTADAYTVDRFRFSATQSSKITWGQNLNSVTPPAGFTNYLGTQTASAYTVGSTDLFAIFQRIEGYNTADLAWGTANAKTVTLSFWVYSSLTGTFGGALKNNAATRSYPFSYTVSSANTWTQISITIAGDTTGTWETTTNTGIQVYFSLGMGSSKSSTAGAWAAGDYSSSTGATSVVGTASATWYVTGIQLEVGSSATGFEYMDYGRQLAQCQRYCQVWTQPPLRGMINSGSGQTFGRAGMPLIVPMRTAPTATAGALPVYDANSTTTVSSIAINFSTAQTAEFDFNLPIALTTGRPAVVYQSGTSTMTLSAEL